MKMYWEAEHESQDPFSLLNGSHSTAPFHRESERKERESEIERIEKDEMWRKGWRQDWSRGPASSSSSLLLLIFPLRAPDASWNKSLGFRPDEKGRDEASSLPPWPLLTIKST